MFYQFDDEITTISIDEINPNLISAGYITKSQVEQTLSKFGITKKLDVQKNAGVQININEEFIEISLKPINNGDTTIIATKNKIIIIDKNSSMLEYFMTMLKRYSPEKVNVPRLISAFFDAILNDDFKSIEQTGFKITELEEDMLNEKSNDEFSIELLKIKKSLLTFLGFYNELLSAQEMIIDESSEIFDCDTSCIDALHLRTERIKADINALQGAVVHLQETYSAYLDLKLNQTMKGFTVITTIFFPLTVIASWYGMNFRYMPEISWEFGYVFAIVLSVIIVAILLIIGKRKNWL